MSTMCKQKYSKDNGKVICKVKCKQIYKNDMEKIKLPNYSYVTIYKINKSEINKIDFILCNQPTETLESFYKRQTIKPNILFNGGLFSLSNGNTYFTYRDENKTISACGYCFTIFFSINCLIFFSSSHIAIRIGSHPL